MSTTKSGGCGCAGCDCGTGTCTVESFERPRFFAGQLLTEDDLQAMMNYVVGKNRLRNRYLFGDGVVCGLTVTCHPCGGGSVMVAPGYGLDCCGNDLLLPCAEEVDIRALLRDLRRRQLAGYDCGDPCDDKGDTRSYGLYLVYRETPKDPVAPYNSGDPCGQQACEPTRICEGYAFELRCECTLEDKLTLYRQIWACIGGDTEAATGAVQRAGRLYGHAMRIKQAVANAGAAVADLKLEVDTVEERRTDAAMLKAWLLSRLEQSASRTRCDLYDRVLAVRLPSGTAASQIPDVQSASAEADDQLELVQVLLEYLIDCVCLALNPPCGTCDDTALLLACVEVKGCDVVDVCNLSRRFVLSPAALRYWLPVDLLGKAFEYVCCEFDVDRLFEVRPREQEYRRTVAESQPVPPAPAPPVPPSAAGSTTAMAAVAAPAAPDAKTGLESPVPAFGENARVALERLGLRAADLANAANFSKSLAALALSVGNVEKGDVRRRASVLTDDLAARLRPDAGSIVEIPAVKERMSAMVKEEVAATRSSIVEELRADVGAQTEEKVGSLGADVAADVSSKVVADVDRRVSEVVGKELTGARLNQAVDSLAVVKALRKENEKLRADLGKLSETVKKLGARP